MTYPAGIEFKTLYPVIGFSIFMFIICMSAFGIAVHRGMNRLFAPRSWARPKAIIKNQIGRPYSLSWIPWALRLSYSEMLEGIEGTGTRDNGWSGTKLCCNLDGIILIKFVNLCLRVAVLATILCVGLVLPANFTAQCVPEAYDDFEEGNRTCYNFTQLTTFEKTTMANIPQLVYSANSTWYSPDLFKNAFGESTGITIRMLTTLLVCFAIYTYTCVLIWEEWIQNLALRRVYYLEYNHYEHRKAEIEYIESLKDPEDINTTNRPVFVVHPEYRDTVPNISLYSVLFRIPLHNGVNGEDNSSHASISDVGRQLQLAIEFFDKVVPNQPGYSSSIAALTILPDVKRLSQAWKRWFRCAGKVRRLNFIRQRLQQLREEQKSKNEDKKVKQNENGSSVGQSQRNGLENIETSKISNFEGRSRPRRLQNACTEEDLESARRTTEVDIKEESNMEMFLDEDEIEQMTVYYREFARSSSSCGPYGCDEYAILQADVTELEDLEEEAAEEVSVAIDQLHKARDEIRVDESSSAHFESPDMSPRLEIDVDVRATENKNKKPKSSSDLWEQAEKLVGAEQYMVKLGGHLLKRKMNTGSWFNPFGKSRFVKDFTTRRVVENVIPTGFLSKLNKSESYAVVTFTSRQAAIAARQCLSDGSGLDGWREIDKIPIPPLADSVPWNIFDCRGCCRPVTVTLPQHARRFRFKLVVVVMILFSTSWTFPFYLLSSKTSPEELAKAFESVPNIQEYAKYLSPWLNTAVMIGFFALLPQIFKMFANFAGEATSIQEAERHALIYYWWFMLVFVFGGKTLGNVIWTAFKSNNATFLYGQTIIRDLAKVVPTTQSFYWLTWMITQTGIILPFMYFLQFNNFMFTALNWDCCARATAGGGPGGVLPYRVYVNSGVIFLCVVALAPLCPIVAPFSMLYFLFITPLLKWGHIFVYRPTFDAGGMRWPILHNMLMVSVILSQVLLALSFFLKKAFLLGVISILSIIATWTFKNVCKDTFEQSYNDAALLQTSELDGWNVDEEMTYMERERYRKWVVDCHKASYVPVCVNAEDDYLTSEPAAVIPTQKEIDNQSPLNIIDMNDFRDQSSISSPKFVGRQRASTVDSCNTYSSQRTQRGAIFRRVTGTPIFQSPNENSSYIMDGFEPFGSPIVFSQKITETSFDHDMDEDSREKML